MAMVFPDQFGTFLQFQQALDALRASSWLEPSISGGGAFPPLNVFRKGDDIVIIAELPGIRKADVQIQVKGRTIRLAGTKPVEYGEKAGVHRRERLAGSFDRAVTLPVEIDADRVRAEYHEGILALYLRAQSGTSQKRSPWLSPHRFKGRRVRWQSPKN
jgi:HSP20 family protein